MESHRESPVGALNPVAEKALHWVVRRLDAKAWTENDETQLRAWRTAAPEHDREFTRHEFVAELVSQPQVHRDEAKTLQRECEAAPEAGEALAEVRALLREAETPGLPQCGVLSLLEAAISGVRDLIVPGQNRYRHLLAEILLKRAARLGRQDGARHLQEILNDYDEAETQLLTLLPDQNPSWREDLADLCTHRGVALMSAGSATATAQALVCFDRALEIRRTLQVIGNFWDHYNVVAAWMNRGDALFRLGSAVHLDEAAKSYDVAVGLMAGIPLADQPLFRRRYVIACVNRSSILLARGGTDDLERAVQSSIDALAVLPVAAESKPIEKMLAASAWANRAAAHSRMESASGIDRTRWAAREALALIADAERDNVQAAEAGIKARHALCVAITKLISAEIAGDVREQWVSEAMRAVNEGLHVSRAWEIKSSPRFQMLATELFHFGARLSEQYQPHLVGHFFLTHLDPNLTPEKVAWRRELLEAALLATEGAMQRLLGDRLAKTTNAQVADYFLDALNELGLAQARLRELVNSPS